MVNGEKNSGVASERREKIIDRYNSRRPWSPILSMPRVGQRLRGPYLLRIGGANDCAVVAAGGWWCSGRDCITGTDLGWVWFVLEAIL